MSVYSRQSYRKRLLGRRLKGLSTLHGHSYRRIFSCPSASGRKWPTVNFKELHQTQVISFAVCCSFFFSLFLLLLFLFSSPFSSFSFTSSLICFSSFSCFTYFSFSFFLFFFPSSLLLLLLYFYFITSSSSTSSILFLFSSPSRSCSPLMRNSSVHKGHSALLINAHLYVLHKIIVLWSFKRTYR